MADSEQVLTQEQIDAMLAGGTVEQSVPAEASVEAPVAVLSTTIEEVRAQEPEAPPPPIPAPAAAPGPAPLPAAAAPVAPPVAAAAAPVAPPVAAADSGALQGTIDQLSQRLAQLESSMQQSEQLRSDFQAWVVQLQTITSTVESLMVSLQGTVGYGAHQNFVCSSCQSQGNVAAKLNCTACGEENMWGWWPPQQQ